MAARKHDGFRILARKDGNRVKLITRNGYDFADRFPLIVDGIASLPMETCIIDGEATVVDQNGLLVFDLLCYRQHDHAATLWTFGDQPKLSQCSTGRAARCPVAPHGRRHRGPSRGLAPAR
jgi:hypothetical protein